MHITYLDQLKPLFESPTTIRMGWTATYDPSFTAWQSLDGLSGMVVGFEIVIGRR
jgi:hypothetical protein